MRIAQVQGVSVTNVGGSLVEFGRLGEQVRLPNLDDVCAEDRPRPQMRKRALVRVSLGDILEEILGGQLLRLEAEATDTSPPK